MENLTTQSSSTYKMLYLLNLLLAKDYTKKDIIEKFRQEKLQITPTLITRYIDKINKSGIEIKTKINDKREKIYYFDKDKISLDFTETELNVINDVKKLLINQKDYDKIRKTMKLFYKLAGFIKNQDKRLSFIDFDYYSKINWFLVRTLEEHCKNKDIITLDYLLPHNGNKFITIQADSLKVSEWSQRLYLYGVLFDSNHFSHLPVDRIFMIKKVEQEKAPLKIELKNVYYEVSRAIFEKLPSDEKENIVEIKGERLKIQRLIDDDFSLLQRLFCYAPEIYNISDERIKKLFKEKLEMLKAVYEN